MKNKTKKYFAKIAFAALLLSASLPAAGYAAIEHVIDPTIYQNKFGYYYVPMNHKRPALNAIKAGKVWEEETLAYIQEAYVKGTSIIHAGAYFGDMLPFYSKLVGSNSVWAFEQAEINFICAKATRLINNLKNVKLFQLAVSNKNIQVAILTKRNGVPLGGSSTLYEGKKNNLEEIELIDSVKLDDLIPREERIGIIHLDIEGHELKALQGAQRIINENHPLLVLEVWSNKSEEIHQHVTSLGYQHVDTLNGNRVYRFH